MPECVSCNQPLVVEIDNSSEEEEEKEEDDVKMGESSAAGASNSNTDSKTETVPDDVHLNCGCHFHWECLLDAYTVTECPHCNKSLVTTSDDGTEQVLCNLNNEGGLQENLDILPLLTEESYLKAYPSDRKPRAFLEFCREGDFHAIINMLQTPDDPSNPSSSSSDNDPYSILTYQDPMGDMQSGLHAAVVGQSREVAWLLLLLASEYSLMEFPPLVFQEAASLGVMRPEEGLEGRVDVRTLRDAKGRSAEDLAEEVGGVWHGWSGTGRLAVEGMGR
ncbi:hypothetical protein EJ08DRAFT_672895 [Tothia fuscella]|uniref:Uncharacterized protein n=1 Tax=Tothia fuscella TaxID=1048955 RepID=A0A9P4TTU5_9PEZI|nr:hypothetical protein EJ08DRAFT_672895 [Tothia fuscella]